MARAIKPASEWGSKWQSGMSGATAAYTAGVQRVQTAPGQLAAANKQGYLQGVNNSVDMWASRVASVSNQAWQAATVNKGAPRLASGATAALPKYEAFAGKFGTWLQSEVNNLGPRGTFDQNLSRLNKYLTDLHAQRGNFRAPTA